MSVLMTATFRADGRRLEDFSQANPDLLASITRKAKAHGLIAHRFYGDESAIVVVDQWPDEASFRSFFAESPEIGEMMAAVGVTEEPTFQFYRALDVDDAVEPAPAAHSG